MTNDEARDEAAARLAAMGDEFRTRGLGGAGEATLTVSATAEAPSSAGLQAAAEARERAMRALLAGGEAAQKAESADYAAARQSVESL